VEEEKYEKDAQILGITGGGQTLNITKKHFYEFLKKIVEIATLQTSYLAIDECLKITNRRVNALEYIVVPRIQYTIKYIITELDERAKEEKFKIKKVLKNKKRHQENEEMQRMNEKKLLGEAGSNFNPEEFSIKTNGNFFKDDENVNEEEEVGEDEILF
jgi:V-type H+-transporting ATPase subunit D